MSRCNLTWGLLPRVCAVRSHTESITEIHEGTGPNFDHAFEEIHQRIQDEVARPHNLFGCVSPGRGPLRGPPTALKR